MFCLTVSFLQCTLETLLRKENEAIGGPAFVPFSSGSLWKFSKVTVCFDGRKQRKTKTLCLTAFSELTLPGPFRVTSFYLDFLAVSASGGYCSCQQSISDFELWASAYAVCSGITQVLLIFLTLSALKHILYSLILFLFLALLLAW